jgi:hypothetical protein
LGESTLLLDGLEDFDGGADFGLKCEVTNASIENMISTGITTTPQLTGAGALNRDGTRITFLEQILFGGYTKTGRKMGGGTWILRRCEELTEDRDGRENVS